MEKEFFSWNSWDFDGTIMMFNDVTLTKTLGNHKVGEKFSSISWNLDSGTFEIWGETELISTHHMVLREVL